MFESVKNIFKIQELKKKILISLGLLIVYRIGCFVPTPGIDTGALAEPYPLASRRDTRRALHCGPGVR